MSNSMFSRRNFLKGATAMAASSVALTGCGSDSSTSSAAPFWLPAKWDAEADVIVVGFGAAGAAAAYTAAKANAKVLVLDVTETGGGDTAASGGIVFTGGGTALQQQAGITETPDEMYAFIRAAGGESADPEQQKTWCRRNKDAYDFMVACGQTFSPSDLVFTGMEAHGLFKSYIPAGASEPVPHAVFAKGQAGGTGMQGAALFKSLSDKVLATAGITFKSFSKVTGIIQNPQTKRVLGVQVRTVDDTGAFVDDKVLSYKASKGVIICTGCFGSNDEMKKLHSADLARFTNWATPTADGSGIKLGQLLGADLVHMKTFWAYHVAAASLPDSAKTVFLNPAGVRFVPEDAIPYWFGYLQARVYPTAFAFSSADVWDGSAGHAVPAGAYQGATVAELVAAINAGEAANGIKLSTAVVQASIDSYNAGARDQVDDPALGKAPSFLVELKTGPFYAVKLASTGALGTPTGGLRTNTKSQLLDAQGNAIPGAYAAGTCASGAASEVYTGSGTAISSALTFGIIAAENVVTEAAWS